MTTPHNSSVDVHYEPASQPNTIQDGGGRRWVHAASVKGKWQTLRNVVAAFLLLFFYATPWLSIDGKPFLRLSFLETSFFLLGQTILIYEFHHFVLLALLLVLTLFLASAVAGRVWCGWACPQTIFVEHVLMRLDALIEGPAARRLAREGKPLSMFDVARKTLKHALYLIVCLSFAATLVAFFTGPHLILKGQNAAWGAIAILTGLAWFNGGWWREQFCHIVCPYARFQSVMQDFATRTIGYDAQRGEPRARGKKREGKGSCIDCGLCVRVCPSGIDIRQGPSQIECIGCARCIDACDEVMRNTKQDPGLIRYDALAIFHDAKSKLPSIIRPRVVVYLAVWTALAAGGVWLFMTRVPFHVKQIAAGKAAPYTIENDNLNNIFTIKIANQGRAAESYTISLHNAPASLRIASPTTTVTVEPGQEITLPVLLVGSKQMAGQSVHLRVGGQISQATEMLSRTFTGPSHERP